MGQAKASVIRSDLDIVIARTIARDTARSLGFGAIDQARIATAVSELARNIFLYIQHLCLSRAVTDAFTKPTDFGLKQVNYTRITEHSIRLTIICN